MNSCKLFLFFLSSYPNLRSNFISRLSPDKRSLLLTRLSHLAASWGGKDNGFGLSDCCQDKAITHFPTSATTLHFEFYAEVEKSEMEDKSGKKTLASNVTIIHVEGLDKMDKTPAKIMEELLEQFDVPEEKQVGYNYGSIQSLNTFCVLDVVIYVRSLGSRVL